jgi:hypothetical protein
MRDYKLYIFRRGHIAELRPLAAEDDALAIEKARALCTGEQAELWEHDRRVREFRASDGRSSATLASH